MTPSIAYRPPHQGYPGEVRVGARYRARRVQQVGRSLYAAMYPERMMHAGPCLFFFCCFLSSCSADYHSAREILREQPMAPETPARSVGELPPLLKAAQDDDAAEAILRRTP